MNRDISFTSKTMPTTVGEELKEIFKLHLEKEAEILEGGFYTLPITYNKGNFTYAEKRLYKKCNIY